MIERKLDLRKNLYVHFLDEASKDTYGNKIWVPLEKTERTTLWGEYANHPGRKPRGFRLVKKVAWFAIIAWGALIVLEVSRYFGCFS